MSFTSFDKFFFWPTNISEKKKKHTETFPSVNINKRKDAGEKTEDTAHQTVFQQKKKKKTGIVI